MRPLVAALLLAAAPAAALPDAPPRFLHDGAGMLDAGGRAAVERRLVELHARGTEIGVALLPSLDGEPIENVALAIAERWRPGDASRDDGALIVVARRERAIRIEIGYGLEPFVTDAAAGRIIRNLMAPRFRRGQTRQGLLEAIDALATLADGGRLPEAARGRPDGDGESILVPLIVIALWLLLLWLRRRHPSIWIGGGGWGRGHGSSGGGSSGGGSFGGGSFGGGGASGGW